MKLFIRVDHFQIRMRIHRTSLLATFAIATAALLLSAFTATAQTPPFDTSPAAVAARAAFYNVPGRDHLTGLNSPLTAGAKIDFFGDSITWLNGYVANIQTAINNGPGTAGKGIVAINHGDDGAGVLQVRDGENTNHGFGGTVPQPFAATIAVDKPKVAVVFIGVNDVWWRGTPADTFRQGLQDIVNQGKATNVTMVLATLAVNGERPDGTNPNDLSYDQFAQITRDVASSTGTTLVDLRKAFMYYEMNNNPYLLSRSGWNFQSSGILTYDGIHPSAAGNNLLADQIAEGIYQSLVPEPTALTLLAIASFGALGHRRRRR